jgi:hypothetical protein
VARALKRSGDHALVLRAGSCARTRKDFRVRRHEAAQCLRVLEVYRADLVGAEVAHFLNLRSVVLFVVTIVVICHIVTTFPFAQLLC